VVCDRIKKRPELSGRFFGDTLNLPSLKIIHQ
jgi:hypothetical protein